jgi:pimeloyl-ACP methyl ester carboxylesterase
VRSSSRGLYFVLFSVWGLSCRAGGSGVAPASGFFEADGVRIHYLVAGSGEPVVLIHGLGSSAEVTWQWPGTLAALAARHRVVALDLPGHGRSDKPERKEAYGLQMIEDVVRLLDHLDIRKAHVVGYSMGGMVALKLVAEHPDRVLSATLGGMGWLQEGGQLQWVWEHMAQERRGRTPAPLRVCAASLGHLALTAAELQAIKAPVLVLVGDRDPVRRLYVAPLRAVRRDWPMIEIQGAGHIDLILRKQFREEIVRWVEKTPPASGSPRS